MSFVVNTINTDKNVTNSMDIEEKCSQDVYKSLYQLIAYIPFVVYIIIICIFNYIITVFNIIVNQLFVLNVFEHSPLNIE